MCISVNHLRSYKRDGFRLDIKDLDIEKTHVISIVGSNGCGKTTFMESLLGLIPSEVRDISFLNKKIEVFERANANKKHLGVQLQKSQYHKEMLVQDLARLYKMMYGNSSKIIFDALDINDLMPLKYEKLSRGQRQRVDLYLALSHQPKILLLDEPSTGLDVKYQRILIELIELLRTKDTTVLMVSHLLPEINLSNKVILMEQGKIKCFDSYSAIVTNSVGRFKFTARCNNSETAKATHHFLKLNESVKTINFNEKDLSFNAYLNSNILKDFLKSFSPKSFKNLSVRESELDDVLSNSHVQDLDI